MTDLAGKLSYLISLVESTVNWANDDIQTGRLGAGHPSINWGLHRARIMTAVHDVRVTLQYSDDPSDARHAEMFEDHARRALGQLNKWEPDSVAKVPEWVMRTRDLAGVLLDLSVVRAGITNAAPEEGALERIGVLVEQLRSVLQEPGFDNKLRRVLMANVAAIRRALDEFPFRGHWGLRDALNQAVMEFSRMEKDFFPDKDEPPKVIRVFLDLLKTVDLVVSRATGRPALTSSPEELGRLLGSGGDVVQ